MGRNPVVENFGRATIASMAGLGALKIYLQFFTQRASLRRGASHSKDQPQMGMDTITAAIDVRLDDAGNLEIFEGGNRVAIIKRQGLTLELRQALTTFVKSISELRSIDEWQPGEVVVAANACMVRDQHGLPFTVMRGQRIDERSIIEQILTIREPEPIRLLRYGTELEVETLLREALTVKAQEGLAQSWLIQKRTAQAMRG